MKITEYLQSHDKGAGGACQGSFFVSVSYLDKKSIDFIRAKTLET
ncbi:hypothetical protein [Wolbachia endosymbiont (group A) of Pogonocherus hispidulus]